MSEGRIQSVHIGSPGAFHALLERFPVRTPAAAALRSITYVRYRLSGLTRSWQNGYRPR